jgi:DNA-binding CsgD family transcriptional regulator/tetratricopeptide (TPR) repeat protein
MPAPGAEGLLERDLELAHFQRALDHTSHGIGRLMVIEGAAGIGKTTLLAVMREMASDVGLTVRAARGAELEQGFAFGVVRQLFDPVIAAADAAQRSELLSGAAELSAPLFDPRSAMSQSPGEDSIYPRLHGLYWLCSNLARTRPLVLCLDDAQWADDPSLAFFGFLARRIEDLPILLVAASRPALPHPRPELSALVTDPAARVIVPRGLTAEGAHRLLAQGMSGEVDPAFARACHDATAGNPFLLGELISEMNEAGIAPVAAHAADVQELAPQRIAEAMRGRLARASPAALVLARAVAILGDGARLSDAAVLAGLDEPTALEAVGAMRAGDLFGHESGLTFAHPIIRASIYQSMLHAERVIHHAHAAELLRAREAPPEQVAAQLLLAEGVEAPWMLEHLQLAAQAALALGAPGNAVAYLRRGLQIEQEPGDHAALLAQLGQAEVLAGAPDAPEHLYQAVRLTSGPAERVQIAISLAQVLKFTGSAPSAVELLSGADSVDDQALNDRVEMELLSNALISFRAHELLLSRIRGVREHGPPDRGLPRTPRERFASVLLAFEDVMTGDRPVSWVEDLVARAGADFAPVDEHAVLPPWMVAAGAALIYCDKLDEAERIFNAVIQRSRRRGSLIHLLIGLSRRAEIAYRRGDLAEALDDATAAVNLYRNMPVNPVLLQHPIATINNIAAERDGVGDDLDDRLRQADQHLDRDSLHSTLALHSRARLLRAAGRLEPALTQLMALAELAPAYGIGNPSFTSWRSDAALILHQLGDARRAQRFAAEEVKLARAFGAPRALGIALRVLALVQAESELDLLGEAATVLQASPARLERARTLVDLGAATRRAGERARSRGPLREGHELAVLCGAEPLADRARREIEATGARVAPAGLRGVASLTPSELRIAELAADGQTNREIAQALFITDSTVETHLRHIYDKLDVRSRRKLAGALVPAGAASG